MADGYEATHAVPPTGLPAWPVPDGTGPPAAVLDPGLDVEVFERRADWAHIRCSQRVGGVDRRARPRRAPGRRPPWRRPRAPHRRPPTPHAGLRAAPVPEHSGRAGRPSRTRTCRRPCPSPTPTCRWRPSRTRTRPCPRRSRPSATGRRTGRASPTPGLRARWDRRVGSSWRVPHVLVIVGSALAAVASTAAPGSSSRSATFDAFDVPVELPARRHHRRRSTAQASASSSWRSSVLGIVVRARATGALVRRSSPASSSSCIGGCAS